MNIKDREFDKEFQFNASRSGGAGGQNVNKVATKVELRFHVLNSNLLTQEEKLLILDKLANRITGDGYLQLICQDERSQLKNKELCIKRFYELLQLGLTKQKKRTASKPTKSSIKRRLDNKKRLAQKKTNRNYKQDS
jgi:ribosome-associated protein